MNDSPRSAWLTLFLEHPPVTRGATFIRFACLLGVTLGFANTATEAWGGKPAKRPRRAAPPQFEVGQGKDAFFENALKEGLEGTRPDYFGKKAAIGSATVTGGNPVAAGSAGGDWSRLISDVTIEDTIKSARLRLDKIITQPAAFASGGNRAARREFVTLATMFAIVSEYQGDVRWKSDSIAARDRCRNAAQVCKVGSVQAYNAAKATKDEISDLIGGNRLGEVEATANVWEQLADRSTLMQQLESLFDELIQPAVANDASFKSQTDEILVAAELSAAIAEILMKDGMEDGGDEDYSEYCEQIQSGAKDIVDAIKQSNGGAARTATGVISKACSECHESYRG